MGQLIFFILFIAALITGIFIYLPHSQKPVNPMVFISDQSGYTTTEERNRKRMEQANITTNQGLTQVRRQMQEIAEKQKNFSDMLAEEERQLNTTGGQASALLAEAQKASPKRWPGCIKTARPWARITRSTTSFSGTRPGFDCFKRSNHQRQGLDP